MDIDILLALQEFRFLINDALTPFMIYCFIIVLWPAVMKRAIINKENTSEENDVMEDLK